MPKITNPVVQHGPGGYFHQEWRIYRTEIKGGVATTYVSCYQPNNWGMYWSEDLTTEHAVVYYSQNEALSSIMNKDCNEFIHPITIWHADHPEYANLVK